MRRKDRQITELHEILEIISGCDICRLAMSDGGAPYVVPLNFGYELQGTELSLYFHSASEGRKLDILHRNPRVCFEMDRGIGLIDGESACEYGYKYESVIGYGDVEFIDDTDAKRYALNRIMSNYTGKADYEYPDSAITRVTVFSISTSDFTAKRNS